jgi:exodeoxyribonuclease VII small subunit
MIAPPRRRLTHLKCACNLAAPDGSPPDASIDEVSSNITSADEKSSQPLDFERSLAELEEIVEKLEQGDLSLEDSLKHFERGVQLTRACQTALKQAEQKVEILMRKSGAGDQFEAAPFDASDDERDR